MVPNPDILKTGTKWFATCLFLKVVFLVLGERCQCVVLRVGAVERYLDALYRDVRLVAVIEREDVLLSLLQ
jgi:hypothetical protein